MMKGQVAAEFLITLGVILLFTLPVVFLLFSISQLGYEDSTLAQADAASRALAETVNFVYSEGPGAMRTVLISTPPSTQSITIGKEITVTIMTSKGPYSASTPIFANATKTTIKRSGLFQLEVKNKDGTVNVKEVS